MPRSATILLLACGACAMLALAGCGFCLSCKSDYERRPPQDLELATLAAFMTGSFTSADQAATAVDFREITLETVRIWRDHPEGIWLYVEQATAARPDQPYRQRVYHLVREDDDTVVSRVHLLPDEAAWIGAWREPARFDALSPSDLALREGCATRLDRINAYTWRGGTAEKSCPSELHGAAWASSEVEIRPGVIESWDRGWDEDGNQIWGSESGPYVFRRIAR